MCSSMGAISSPHCRDHFSKCRSALALRQSAATQRDDRLSSLESTYPIRPKRSIPAKTTNALANIRKVDGSGVA